MRVEPTAPSPTTTSRIGSWIRLAAGLLLLAALLALADLRSVLALVADASPAFLAGAALLCAVDRAVMIGKWFPLLSALVPDARLAPAARAYLASNLAAIALPASVGGEILRAAAVGRGRGTVAEVSASIAMERALGMAATGVASLLALSIALSMSLPVAALLPWSAVAVLTGFAAVVLPATPAMTRLLERLTRPAGERAWVRFLRRLWSAYAAYARRPGLLLAVGAVTVLEQGFPIATVWCVGKAIGAAVSWPMVFVSVPLAMFTQRIPLTLWGLGISDGALVYLLGLFGIPAREALAMSLLGRAVDLAVLSPGALFWPEMMRRVAGSPSAAASPPESSAAATPTGPASSLPGAE